MYVCDQIVIIIDIIISHRTLLAFSNYSSLNDPSGSTIDPFLSPYDVY